MQQLPELHRPPAPALGPGFTPTISVVVLAAMLAVAVRAAPSGQHVWAPEASRTRPAPDLPLRHVVGVDRAGQYYLDRKPIRNARLAAGLDSVSAGEFARELVYVWADRDVASEAVAGALQAVRAAGFRRAALIVEEPRGT